jgi:hypothetical protein
MTVDRSGDATLPRRLPHSISYSRVCTGIDRLFVWGFPCLETGIDLHGHLVNTGVPHRWAPPPALCTLCLNPPRRRAHLLEHQDIGTRRDHLGAAEERDQHGYRGQNYEER